MSLQSFAKAKAPGNIKLRKIAQHRIAKKHAFHKYAKLKKQLARKGELPAINIQVDAGSPNEDVETGSVNNATAASEEVPEARPNGNKHCMHRTTSTQVAQEASKELHMEDHRARTEEAKRSRQQTKAKFFKKTKRGQPVMKYRIEKIINALQH